MDIDEDELQPAEGNCLRRGSTQDALDACGKVIAAELRAEEEDNGASCSLYSSFNLKKRQDTISEDCSSPKIISNIPVTEAILRRVKSSESMSSQGESSQPEDLMKIDATRGKRDAAGVLRSPLPSPTYKEHEPKYSGKDIFVFPDNPSQPNKKRLTTNPLRDIPERFQKLLNNIIKLIFILYY